MKAVDPDFDRIPQRGLADHMDRDAWDETHRQQFAPIRCASLGESHYVTSVTGFKFENLVSIRLSFELKC